MRLFHYTTIGTLAHIMNNRSLKFNRLDQLDDITESEPFADFNPLEYIFSCSFTYDPIENIPLWRMYANMETGIRIEFDSNEMFAPSFVPITMPQHSHECCEFPPFIYTSLKVEDIINKDYVLAYWNLTEPESLCSCIKLKKVIYVNDFQEKYKFLLTIKDNIENRETTRNISYTPTDFGFYKSKYWEFQKEIRGLIYAIPFPKDNNAISNVVSGKRKLKTKYILVPLSNEALNNLKIVLAPKATDAAYLVVKSLTRDFPNITVQYSELNGKIR